MMAIKCGLKFRHFIRFNPIQSVNQSQNMHQNRKADTLQQNQQQWQLH